MASSGFPKRLVSFVAGLLAACIASALVSAQEGANTPPPPPPPPPAQRPPVITPKAQEILDKTIQALGGAAFLNFKRLTTTGRVFAIEDENTAGMAPYQSHVEFPDKRRFSYGKGAPVVLINNGEQGLEIDRFGTIRQKRDQLLGWRLTTRFGLENLLRLRIHEPGILIQDTGTDFIDNFPARVITMIDARQEEIKLYINKLTFLPIRVQYRVRNEQQDDWDVYADVYADFQAIQGIKTPMHISRFLNDERIAENFRNSAKYDEDFPPSYFQVPY